jgi:dual specificity MAP kinase phosphatase
MTRGSEVVEGFWVGNDCDVPGGADDGAGARVSFDLCVKASECSDMPTAGALSATYRKLIDLDRRRHAASGDSSSHSLSALSWVASPATLALRNLLSPTSSPAPLPDVISGSGSGSKRVASPSNEDPSYGRHRRSRVDGEYISLECAGSCRTISGQMRNLNSMTDRVVDLVYFLRKIIEGRDKSGVKRRVLVHCQDGYTESSIVVLSYIMSSLSISLPEAFLHLQLHAKRSFFLYPSDKPLLRKIDARLAADRRAKAIKLVSNVPSAKSTHKLLLELWLAVVATIEQVEVVGLRIKVRDYIHSHVHVHGKRQLHCHCRAR